MKDFSVFDYGLESTPQAQSLGQMASISRKDFEGRESVLCRTTTASVEYACLMIENALLLRTNRSGRVYAGFGRFSQLQPIIDRYMRIADISEYVYLFGLDDWQPPRHPNIRFITLQPDFRLSRELFLITESPSLKTALLAFDEAGADTTMPEQIRYWVLKTDNKTTVSRLVSAIEGVIDWTLAA